jgi:hypothetical protein
MVVREAMVRVGAWCSLACVIGCGDSPQCLIGCGPHFSTLTFEAPIGTPGQYSMTVGSLTCSFELPASSVTCSSGLAQLKIENYAVVGVNWTTLSKTATVHIERNGETVLSETVRPSAYSDGGEGCSCAYASFRVAVPEELVRPERTSCDGASTTAEYAVTELRSGMCPDFDADDLISLEDGVVVVDSPDCPTHSSTWSSDCRLTSEYACQGPSLDANWQMSLTDLLGDGSRLFGTGTISMRAPIVCEGSFQLELRR